MQVLGLGRQVDATIVRLERGGPAEPGRPSNVSLAPTALSAENGEFEFNALPDPPYVIRVEHPDYTPSGPIPVASIS